MKCNLWLRLKGQRTLGTTVPVKQAEETNDFTTIFLIILVYLGFLYPCYLEFGCVCVVRMVMVVKVVIYGCIGREGHGCHAIIWCRMIQIHWSFWFLINHKIQRNQLFGVSVSCWCWHFKFGTQTFVRISLNRETSRVFIL